MSAMSLGYLDHKVQVYKGTLLIAVVGYQIGLNKDGMSVIDSFKHNLPGLTPLLETNKELDSFILADNKLNPMMKLSGGGMALVNRWMLRELLTQGINILQANMHRNMHF